MHEHTNTSPIRTEVRPRRERARAGVSVAWLTLAMAAACVGQLEPISTPGGGADAGGGGPGPGDDAATPTASQGEAMFEAQIRPVVQRCSAPACHTGTGSPLKFLGASGQPADFYGSITLFPSVTGNYNPALANVLLKIAPGNHYAMSYTTQERQLIIDWLDLEAQERGITTDGGGDTPPGVPDPLAQWAGCMTIDNWNLTQMGEWSNKESDEGPCQTCHNDGAFRFNANNLNQSMFDMNRTSLYIISFVTVKVGTDGTQTVVPAYDKLDRMGGCDPTAITLHPEFGCGPDDVYYQYLDQFYNLTMQAKASGLCGPAEYYVPTL
jgi:hypothetical protein